jgi:hypothetical protein
LGNITGKPKKFAQKCFEKIGKIDKFDKNGHLRSIYSDRLALFKTFAIEKH